MPPVAMGFKTVALDPTLDKLAVEEGLSRMEQFQEIQSPQRFETLLEKSRFAPVVVQKLPDYRQKNGLDVRYF